ncbi:MAG: hypothetical protein JWN48_3551 [Myxococcaceae bacterium]|nr:hypothetical protein [Myxococcaceae bacterium]
MAKNKWLCISVLSALSGVSVASAQHGSPHDVEKMDTNGDGVVTTAEVEAGALDHFNKSDTNHDGKVTADELKSQFGAMKHDEATHEPDSFAKLDANGDGKLEKGELAKMPAAKFKKLDADKNGSLSAAELVKGQPEPHGQGVGGPHPEHGEMMKGMLPGDTNHDGALTKAEAQADASSMAKRLDADGDGKISKDELAKLHGMHGMPEAAGHGVGKTGKDEGAHGGMHHAPPKPQK